MSINKRISILISVIVLIFALGFFTVKHFVSTKSDSTVTYYTCADLMGDMTGSSSNKASQSEDISLNPEGSSGYRSGMKPIQTNSYSVATANPLSTKYACEALNKGATAADALIVAQTVLGLVEPQSSGLGGGAFALYYDGKTKKVSALDARETAPAAADEDYLRFISSTEKREPLPEVRASGRSIGVPGVPKLLETLHQNYGKLAWKELFKPAMQLANSGFEISPRMATVLASNVDGLSQNRNAAAYYLNPDLTPKVAGTLLKNPAYAHTLSILAEEGAKPFYQGKIADDIIAEATKAGPNLTPSKLTKADFENYAVKLREPLVTNYRGKQIVSMPEPSSGGITVAATLGILSNFNMNKYAPENINDNGGLPTVMGVHLISEAERLAYADRDKYLADPDFVPLPGKLSDTLLNNTYLAGRAKQINLDRSMGFAQPGMFNENGAGNFSGMNEHGTSHISIADKYGNYASMTTTVESAFGSYHFVDGFSLNNQLTDFSIEPKDETGAWLANRIQPGKRPRSSMSPTLIFDLDKQGNRGNIAYILGSPGGAVIIQFVVKTIVGLLDWGLDPQQAVGLVDFGAGNSPVTNLGGENPEITGENSELVKGLLEKGHQVSLAEQSSGLSALKKLPNGKWIGGADPRREGAVMGDQETVYKG